MRFKPEQVDEFDGLQRGIFPTPHTLHPTPSLDFNIVVTPSGYRQPEE